MRIALLAAFAACFAMPAMTQSETDPFLKGDELKAAVERDCVDGCITFNREEADNFQAQLETIINRREREAFEAGVQAQKSACRSLI